MPNKLPKTEKSSVRSQAYIKATAQKIILDHIKIWLLLKSGWVKLNNENHLPMIDIPTPQDYISLMKVLEDGLEPEKNSTDELDAIGIPITQIYDNFYFICIPNFKVTENKIPTRPEDHRLKEKPLMRCLVVTREALIKKFKSRKNFERVIINIRAILFGVPVEERTEKQQKKEQGKSYVEIVKSSNSSDKNKIISRYKRLAGHRASRDKSALQKVIKTYFHDDREYFNKVRQLLRKDGLVL